MPVIVRDGDGVVTVHLAGTLDTTCVADLDYALEAARRSHRPVVLDLARVRLIDRPTLQYVIDLMHREVESVINCPEDVRRWIQREATRVHAGTERGDPAADCFSPRVTERRRTPV